MHANIHGAAATVYYLVAADSEQAAIFRGTSFARPRGWRDGWLIDEIAPGQYVGIPVFRRGANWIVLEDVGDVAVPFDFVQRKIARGVLVYLDDDGNAGSVPEGTAIYAEE